MRKIALISIIVLLQCCIVSSAFAEPSPKEFLKERRLKKFCRKNPDAEKCSEIKKAKEEKRAFAEFCKKNRKDEKCVKRFEEQRAELKQFCVEQPDALYCKRKRARASAAK